jgi:hypothetical protein
MCFNTLQPSLSFYLSPKSIHFNYKKKFFVFATAQASPQFTILLTQPPKY